MLSHHLDRAEVSQDHRDGFYFVGGKGGRNQKNVHKEFIWYPQLLRIRPSRRALNRLERYSGGIVRVDDWSCMILYGIGGHIRRVEWLHTYYCIRRALVLSWRWRPLALARTNDPVPNDHICSEIERSTILERLHCILRLLRRPCNPCLYTPSPPTIWDPWLKHEYWVAPKFIINSPST